MKEVGKCWCRRQYDTAPSCLLSYLPLSLPHSFIIDIIIMTHFSIKLYNHSLATLVQRDTWRSRGDRVMCYLTVRWSWVLVRPTLWCEQDDLRLECTPLLSEAQTSSHLHQFMKIFLLKLFLLIMILPVASSKAMQARDQMSAGGP